MTSLDLSLGPRVDKLDPCPHGRPQLEACEACGVPAFDSANTPTALRAALELIEAP